MQLLQQVFFCDLNWRQMTDIPYCTRTRGAVPVKLLPGPVGRSKPASTGIPANPNVNTSSVLRSIRSNCVHVLVNLSTVWPHCNLRSLQWMHQFEEFLVGRRCQAKLNVDCHIPISFVNTHFRPTLHRLATVHTPWQTYIWQSNGNTLQQQWQYETTPNKSDGCLSTYHSSEID